MSNKSKIISKIPSSTEIGEFVTIQKDVILGENCRISNFVNLYGCSLGNDCMVGAMVEIQKNVSIGDRSRVSSHTFICSNVTIGNDCFVGHGVMFINDEFKTIDIKPGVNHYKSIKIENNVIIGSNATIMPVTIGEGSIIGAGAVVTKDVPKGTVVIGNPAIKLRKI